MREWQAGLPPEVVEEINQHLADVHRMALIQGKSTDEADRLVAQEVRYVDQLAAAIARRNAPLTGPPPSPGTGRVWAGMVRDIHRAIRFFAARRAYTAVIVLTLAVGVGGCIAVYSLFNALLRTPLPYPEPDRLVLLWETPTNNPNGRSAVAVPAYRDWAAGTSSFESLGIFATASFNAAGAADPEQILAARTSASLFDVMAVAPALGRVFTPVEQTSGQQVAVISESFWKNQFLADASVLGKAVRLNGRVYEVIGVMPSHFAFPSRSIAVWIPLTPTPEEEQRDWHSFRVAGRLAQGVTFQQASIDVERVGDALRLRHPEHANEGVRIERMADFGLEGAEEMLAALSVAVGLVLLIACINVAGLQLALGVSRHREFATRLSLGARYGHLIRQLVAENFVLAGLGGVGGLVAAFIITRSFDLLLAPGFRNLPFRGDIEVSVDAGALMFAAAISMVSAVLFGIAPLAALGRRSLQPSLRAGDRGATQMATTTRRLLVTGEIALAIVVLASAGIMVRSLATLLQQPPGLDPQHILTMQVSLPQEDIYGPPERRTFCSDLHREGGAVPGILRLSAIDSLPLSGGNSNRLFVIEGRPQRGPHDLIAAEYRVVCPSYFSSLTIPLARGRDFTARDAAGAPEVVIVNRAFVEQHLPREDAIGRRIKLGDLESRNPWLTIVGVAEDVRQLGLDSSPLPEMYRPYSQAAAPVMTVVAKTSGAPLLWATAMRSAIRRVDLTLPTANVRAMDDVIAESVEWRQTPMRLLSGFAVVGLLLAGVGIYSVLAYYVSQRTREFGLRVALGASRRTLVRLVLAQSMLPVTGGVVLGIAGSVWAGRLLSSFLYQVQPGDPIVVAAVVALLALVALASSWVPARRAAAIDPATALRDE